MAEIAEGHLEVAVDTEIIQEVLFRFGQLGQVQVAVSMAQDLLTLIPMVLPVTPPDVRLAVDLLAAHASKGVRARDVLHAAVMRNNGLSQIVSTDRHFDDIEGIRRLEPASLVQDLS